MQNDNIIIALAGNANVGKSAIFNQLTGLTQETGNWAGKTVEIKEGKLRHHQRQIKIVDLPGIYSFTTYSLEEQVARDFIITRHPDALINVVDASTLERSLYFTLQLKEMGVPTVVSLNLLDLAAKKHIRIDTEKLAFLLGCPVIGTVAVKGTGVHELIDSALLLIDNPPEKTVLKYGTEVEDRISRIAGAIKAADGGLPPRWAAIKLLEGDEKVAAMVEDSSAGASALAKTLAAEIVSIHGEEAAAVMAAERYALAARIAGAVTAKPEEEASTFISRLDGLTLHPVFGYAVLFLTMLAILAFISFFGGWLTQAITGFFDSINPHGSGILYDLLWNGAVTGFYASLSVALGFILPFYIILGILSDSGYLPRIAFLMDRPCHLIGLHGQASLPMMLAFGCNVPACLSCRIMENKRDRLVATFLSTMVPCSARTSVVLGLVGAFVGWQWAVAILAFQFVLIFIIGRILAKLNPSTSPGIIMEIPEYRIPSIKIIWSQAWNRFKDFVTLGVPLIIAGSVAIQALASLKLLDYITNGLSPLTVWWLGLPAFSGVLLIFGILRKEASLALLITLAGGAAVNTIMSPLQMVVFSLVILLYIPCISTMAALYKETGFKTTAGIVVGEVLLALIVGGVAYRVLGLWMG
jgi:ferrous iron transport protein B